MHLQWTSWNSITWTTSGPDPKSPVPNTKARLVATLLVTMLSISGVYTGHTWLTAIPIMAFVYDSISCRSFTDTSFRKMIKWVVYFQVRSLVFAHLIRYRHSTVALAMADWSCRFSCRQRYYLYSVYQQWSNLICHPYPMGPLASRANSLNRVPRD